MFSRPGTIPRAGSWADDQAAGWRAYRTGEDGEVDGIEVVCPCCVKGRRRGETE
jgi:hypothetical protein